MSHASLAPDLDSMSEKQLDKLVFGDRSHCDFACQDTLKSKGLDIKTLTDAGDWFLNMARVHLPIGALPCCPTNPYCSAPACTELDVVKRQGVTCTPKPWAESYAYLTHPDVWPAYNGFGGSFYLDIDKVFDVLVHTLGCKDAACTSASSRSHPFDLAVDIGANAGGLTNKFAARSLAKDFILIDADPGWRGFFYESKLGNAAVAEQFFNEHVPKFAGSRPAKYEYLSFVTSNLTTGKVPSPYCKCRNGSSDYEKCSSDAPECQIERSRTDDIIPQRLSSEFQALYAEAQSMFVKIDAEGYDGLVLAGMPRLLSEMRGYYRDGKPRYLVDFVYLEFSMVMMNQAAEREHLTNYDLNFLRSMMEAQGFELFLIGPRYLPISGSSWSESFNEFYKSPQGMGVMTDPQNKKLAELMCQPRGWIACPAGGEVDCKAGGTGSVNCLPACADIFAIRSSHPFAAEIKLALGACTESRDTDLGK